MVPWPQLRYFEAFGSLIKQGKLTMDRIGSHQSPGMPVYDEETWDDHVKGIEALIQSEVDRLETDSVDADVAEAASIAVNGALDYIKAELVPSHRGGPNAN
jgi:hypothetical protein